MSSALVWWLDRNPTEAPLTQHETDFAASKSTMHGLELSGFTHGYDSSSTRSELIGATIALFSEILLALYIDSSAVLHSAWKMQRWIEVFQPDLTATQSEDGTRRMRPLGKKFELMTNGDVLHILFRALMFRGARTVQFHKT